MMKPKNLAIAYNMQKKGKKSTASSAMSDSEDMDSEMRPESISDAIMRKRKEKMMAEGGMVDLNENDEETEPNSLKDQQYMAAKKELYDEDDELEAQPMDSNEMGDMDEDEQENRLDRVSAIRMKMKSMRR